MEERIDVVVDSSSAKRGIDVLVDSVKRMSGAMLHVETSTTRLFDNMTSGLKRVESGFLTLRNIVLSFGAVIGVFKQLGTELTKFQAFISAMSVSVGGAQQARVEYAFLMNMSDKLGISINSLSHNYSQLAAATVGTAITTDKLREIFESFSIAARVMHLSGQDTRLMFYALTQMVSKGAVSMEELRRQLGEKLPGAMKIAAASVNATSDQLESAIRKGIVDPVKFLPIFAEAIRATFGPGLQNAMQAFDAEVNRLMNNVQKLIVVLFDLGVADAFTRVIKELNRILSDKTIAEEFARGIKKIADEIRIFLSNITADEVRKFMFSFANGLSTIGTIAGNILPIMKTLADYFMIIAGAWMTVKGAALGAAAGTAVAGPAGTIPGAVIGGAAGLGTAYSLNNALTGLATGNRGAVSGTIRRPVDPNASLGVGISVDKNGNPVASDRYTSPYKLSDILGGSGKAAKLTPMDNFIQQLNERLVGSGEDGNKYEAFRSHAEALGKKNPQRLDEALKLIDQLEARGDEFKPLVDRINGMIDRQNKETPDTVDRAVEDMVQKYPRALAQHEAARAAAEQFRTQYEEKLTTQQQLFDDKQSEIIRRIDHEKTLYTEQFQLIGKTADQKERIVRQLEMEKRLEEQITQLRMEATREGRAFDEEGFRARGKESIQGAIDELGRLQEATRSVQAGFSSALASYYDMATNMAKHASDLTNQFLSGMEDRLVEFVKTGKLNFKSLADEILTQMLRIAIQQAILGPFAGMMAGMFQTSGSGAAVGGYNGSAGVPVSANVAHTGGVVGHLRKYHGGGLSSSEELAVLKKGEGVFTPEQMKAMGRTPSNVRVEIVNSGSDKEVDKVEPSFDVEGMVVRVILKDIKNNGPTSRNIQHAFGLQRKPVN